MKCAQHECYTLMKHQSWTRVGSGRPAGQVQIFVSSGGSGRVKNLNIFIHVFRKLQNFARTEKL
jgi:hypothetical protein